MKKAGIIWNKGTPEAVVKHHVFDKNKENKHFANFFHDEWQLVLLKEADVYDASGKLNTKVRGNEFSAFFILAELDWQQHGLADFFGIEVTQQLRLNNVKAPVFICSFLPESYFLENEDYDIIGFRGHYFIQLPDNMQEEEVSQLDEMELFDAQSFYCDLKGKISRIFHNKTDIKGKTLEEAKEFLIKDVYGRILNFAGLAEESRKVAKSSIEKVTQIIKIEDFGPLLEQNEAELLAPYKKDEQNSSSMIDFMPESNWEMMILEDNVAQIKDLETIFYDRGIKKIHLANTYTAAVKIIKEDTSNKITVLICDYRLEENGKVKGKQGYSFVQWLAKQNRFNEIFVYSGMARTFQHKTFDHLGIRVHSKNKNELYGSSLKEFVNEIIYFGNQTWNIINSLPTAKEWEGLKPFYSYFRSHSNYQTCEDEISREASIMIEELIDVIENVKLENVDKNDGDTRKREIFNKAIEESLEKCQLTSLKDLRAKNHITKKIGKNTEIPENAIIIKHKDGTKSFEIAKNPADYFEEFKGKLIARRVFIFLHFRYGIEKDTISNLLIRGTVFENETELYETRIKAHDKEITKTIRDHNHNSSIETLKALVKLKALVNKKEKIQEAQKARRNILKQIPFSLAFQSADYPGRLLVEEKNWLSRMDLIDIRKLNIIVNEIDSYVFSFVLQHAQSMNKKSDNIHKLIKEEKISWLNKNTAGQIQIGQHKRSIFSLFKAQRLIDLLIDTWQNKKVGEELIVGCLNIVNKHSVEFPDYSVDRFIEFCNKNIHHATE